MDPGSVFCDVQDLPLKSSAQGTSSEMFALATQANSNDLNNTKSQLNTRGREMQAMPASKGTYSSSQHHLQNQMRLQRLQSEDMSTVYQSNFDVGAATTHNQGFMGLTRHTRSQFGQTGFGAQSDIYGSTWSAKDAKGQRPKNATQM